MEQLIERESALWFRAERLTLNSIFLGGDILSVLELIKAEDFYFENTRAVFEAMLAIASRGEKSEPLTLLKELKQAGHEKRFDIPVFISEVITGEFDSASELETYAKMVREFSAKRKLINCLQTSLFLATQPTSDTEEIARHSEKELSEISFRKSKNIVQIGEYYPAFADRLEKVGNGSGILGLTTGFKELDAQTSGFVNGEFWVIAARPGIGKTSFSVESLWANGKIGVPGLLVSLEMSGDQIYARLACSKAEVDLLRFRTGKLYETDYSKLTMAAGLIETTPIFLADSTVLEADDLAIRGLVTKAVKTHGIKLIVIDYMQLMRIKGHRGNRETEVSQISHGLKQLARKLEIPVIALSQMSRKLEDGMDRRPNLSSLRESGSIEADADVVIGLYRDEYYKKDSPDKGKAEAIILKQRNGPTSTVMLQFTAAYARFGNLDENRSEVENPENYQEPRQEQWT